MNIRHALPLLALTLSACAANKPPQPIPVMAEQRQCPVYPLPPEELLKAPIKTNFQAPTG